MSAFLDRFEDSVAFVIRFGSIRFATRRGSDPITTLSRTRDFELIDCRAKRGAASRRDVVSRPISVEAWRTQMHRFRRNERMHEPSVKGILRKTLAANKQRDATQTHSLLSFRGSDLDRLRRSTVIGSLARAATNPKETTCNDWWPKPTRSRRYRTANDRSNRTSGSRPPRIPRVLHVFLGRTLIRPILFNHAISLLVVVPYFLILFFSFYDFIFFLLRYSLSTHALFFFRIQLQCLRSKRYFLSRLSFFHSFPRRLTSLSIYFVLRGSGSAIATTE